MRLIDADSAHDYLYEHLDDAAMVAAQNALDEMPTVQLEQRRGHWIECDYKHLEHGEIESAYKAGLCCSECRTGFKKNHMTYKAFCPACGARMEGGIDNG